MHSQTIWSPFLIILRIYACKFANTKTAKSCINFNHSNHFFDSYLGLYKAIQKLHIILFFIILFVYANALKHKYPYKKLSQLASSVNKRKGHNHVFKVYSYKFVTAFLHRKHTLDCISLQRCIIRSSIFVHFALVFHVS